MRLLVGTSGYSYKEWKGGFYSEAVAPGDMLGEYASRLPAVEINNTFYRLPRASVLEGWAGQVPEDFRFAIKASRRITHLRRLKGAESETEYLLRTVESLGERLGVLLFQLPPTMRLDLDRLRAFLELIGDVPAAFEFRHDSWGDEAVHAALAERGAALCLADTDGADEPELVTTARLGYLRLRRERYTDDDLARWLERLRTTGWDEAYVFFKHEDVTGPLLAARMLESEGKEGGGEQGRA